MKCSSCYADNEIWATICQACGQHVAAIAVCPAGHVLPPRSQDCPACPISWPNVSEFTGPPVLRGVFVVERGRLVDSEGTMRAWFEARDGAEPRALIGRAATEVALADDTPDALLKILVRPDGVRACARPSSAGASRGSATGYQAVASGDGIQVGSVRLRLLTFHAPNSA